MQLSMLYLIIGFIFIILQTYLILGTKIVIYPELYFLPWLVNKGLLPYRDFFDHHGFLLYHLFAPLTIDKSFFLLKLTYFFSQTISLFLILLILKKITTKLGFFIGGLMFILMNFFVSENFLWYESYIVSIYLAVYLIIIMKEFRYKYILLGTIIALSSFIKPVAGVIIFPVLLIRKDIQIIVIFLLNWFFVLLYFWLNHGLIQYLQSTFLFNVFLSKNLNHNYSYWPKFTFFFIIISLFTLLEIRKRYKFKVFSFPIMLYFLSFVFLGSNYFGEHFLPLVTFLSILVALTFKNIQSRFKLIYFGLIILFIVYLFKIDIQQHKKFKTAQRIPWQEDKKSILIINELKKLNIGNEKIYVFDNHPEIYMAINQLPPTYFSVHFPLTEKYFSDYEDRIISDLIKRDVKYVIIPKPLDEYFAKLNKIKEYINSVYFPLKDSDKYQILTKDE